MEGQKSFSRFHCLCRLSATEQWKTTWPPSKEKAAQKHFLNPHYKSSNTDFFPKGQGVISKGLMPCRYTKSPWYVYMKAKTRFVESMRLVNTFRVFKFTTQSVNEIWKILSTLFVLNHWSNKKVDLWGLWGGGDGVGCECTLPTPLPTGLYSCPSSDNVMSFWIKFVMIC